ncbi:MAG: hypothetical protein H0X31_01750 [Nostocaceae cyanobacterium]|nr:hypothetical protein [Nostocaceae cyanobacterium]
MLPMPINRSAQKSVDLYLIKPSQCDLVVILFWSRLGTPVNIDGEDYLSGTHYELQDAIRAGVETWVYLRTDESPFKENDSDFDAKCAEYKRLKDFIANLNHKGRFDQPYNRYDKPEDFHKQFKSQLTVYLRHLRDNPAVQKSDEIPGTSEHNSFASQLKRSKILYLFVTIIFLFIVIVLLWQSSYSPLPPFESQFGIVITYFNTQGMTHLSKDADEIADEIGLAIEDNLQLNWQWSDPNLVVTDKPNFSVYKPSEINYRTSATSDPESSMEPEDVKRLAQQYNAAVVVYGYATEVNGQLEINPMIYVNPDHVTFAPELSGVTEFGPTAVQIKDYTSKTPFIVTIENQVHYLAEVYSGLSAFYASNYGEAKGIFQSIINKEENNTEYYKTYLNNILLAMSYIASVDIEALGNCNLTKIRRYLDSAENSLNNANSMNQNGYSYRADSGLSTLYVRRSHWDKATNCVDYYYTFDDLNHAQSYINRALLDTDYNNATSIVKTRLLLNSVQVDYLICHFVALQFRRSDPICERGQKTLDGLNNIVPTVEINNIKYWRAKYQALYKNYPEAYSLITDLALNNTSSTYVPLNQDFRLWILLDKAEMELCQKDTRKSAVTITEALKFANLNQFTSWESRITKFITNLTNSSKDCEYEQQY